MTASLLTRLGGTTSPTKSQLIAGTRLICDNCGVSLSTNKIVRLVCRFLDRAPNAPMALFWQYLAASLQLSAEQRTRAMAHPDIARWIAYADPTGEAATTNVLRRRGF